MNVNSKPTNAEYDAKKQQSKYDAIRDGQKIDVGSVGTSQFSTPNSVTWDHNGIQAQSVFVPDSTSDYEQLGFIHGANGQKNERDNQPYALARIAYDNGYVRGKVVHKPFTNEGTLNRYAKQLKERILG